MKKKILSVFFVVVLILSMVVPEAFATDSYSIPDPPERNDGPVLVCNGLHELMNIPDPPERNDDLLVCDGLHELMSIPDPPEREDDPVLVCDGLHELMETYKKDSPQNSLTRSVPYSPPSAYTLESSHFIWQAGTNYLIYNITPAAFTTWLNRMDTIYEAFSSLVGRVPKNGNKIPIIAESGNFWAAARHDSVILFNPAYIADEMTNINDRGTWSFGIMHEIGHIFDNDGGYYRYVFNLTNEVFGNEGSANLKVLYAMERVPGTTVLFNGNMYSGVGLANLWYNAAVAAYNAGTLFTVSRNTTDDFNAFLVRYLRLTNWQALRDTYRSYFTSFLAIDRTIYSSNRERHLLWDFFDRLKSYTGGQNWESQFYGNSGTMLKNMFPLQVQTRTSLFPNEFAEYRELQTVVIPLSVSSLGTDFYYCANLRTAYIRRNNINISYWAFAANNLTIYGLPNSTAQQYAATRGFTFRVLYDIDGDGRLTSNDVNLVINRFYLAKPGDANWNQAVIYDTNDDGIIDLLDIMEILSYCK